MFRKIKIWQIIKTLYPLRILLMVAYVQVIAMLLNWDLYRFNELLVWLCWIPLLMLPYTITRKRWVYVLMLSVFFAIELPDFLHWLVMKSPLAVYSLMIIANTNGAETADFLQLMRHWRWLLVIPCILLFVNALRKNPPLPDFPSKWWIAGAGMIFPLFFISDGLIHGRFIRQNTPQTLKAVVSFYEELKSYKTLQNRILQNIEITDFKDKNLPHLAVLIIGESGNRSFYALYGSPRNTNPRLSARSDLILFDNVVAGYSNTLQSVLAMLTNEGLNSSVTPETSATLLDVFQAAGFKTFWLSNQSPIGIWDNAVANLAKTANKCKFLNVSASSSFESTLTRSYDEVLFCSMQEALCDTARHKFIVLHLMGSHTDYDKRYPPEFKQFNGGKTKIERLIDSYNNTILYNDFVVDSLFSMLSGYCKKHPETVASAVYLSDHSENIQEALGHTYAGSLPVANVEIPFMIWLSERYKSANDELVTLMRLRASAPFVSDELFHTIIHLNGISTPLLDSTGAFFAPFFHLDRKRILADGEDYDLKAGNKIYK